MLLQWAPLFLLTGVLGDNAGHPIQLEAKREIDSQLANFHLTYKRNVESPHSFSYGGCDDSKVPTDTEAQKIARRDAGKLVERLVWVVPEGTESDGCISLWTEDKKLVGRSEPLKLSIKKLERRDLDWSIPMTPESGIDSLGPWFNGVDALKDKPNGVDPEAMKRKKIAIVGGGISGLMTYLNLKLSGFKNVQIIEASQRLGGRIKTHYFEKKRPWQYQEMGAMRFPKEVFYKTKNETMPMNDQKLVFQLADTLNRMNGNSKEHKIEFIPFVQANPNALYYVNGIRKPNGEPPTFHEYSTNSSYRLTFPPDPAVDAARKKLEEITNDPEVLGDMALNMFKAHKDWMETGLKGLGADDWSEFAYIHNYLKFSLNVTDQLNGLGGHSFWIRVYEGMLFSNPNYEPRWVTISGGLSRLVEAFRPHLGRDDLKLGREIEKVEYLTQGDGKVKLSWKLKYTDTEFKSETYDYAIITAPFSVVRRWRLPRFSLTLGNAIKELVYAGACKIALKYKTRFWEKRELPIYGGSNTRTDIPGIAGAIYPSYGINDTGPGILLGSYSIHDQPKSFLALSKEEHVQHVVNAMIEIHGEPARKQYTGEYNYQCWDLDRYATGAWADPSIGQQKLYMPSYFKTENNIIFIGEHTSFTHSWVASALESSIRGSVQLLLELGLVDEAKEVTTGWMSRWINI
ncbi:hypothetical protein FQN57_006458 [Myotisia sp. PD_48]|nr:hypothetical protein FQN57_006458 [Myotisia sp. PD_48]